jgi:hypothetical protein
MHAKPPWIDSLRQSISNSRWHATWFLTVEELCPLKEDHVNFPRFIKSTPSGIIIKNQIEFYLGQVGPVAA